MANVTLIDNYDSFTFNLVHYFGALGANVTVRRNDTVSVAEVLAGGPDAIVLSPGPCTPHEAGICLDLIEAASPDIPMFGVCLGHQAIGEAFGGDVVRAPLPVHGKMATILHRSETIFRTIEGPFQATRYHSLIVAKDRLPECLHITAETPDGLIMALSHQTLPTHGVQFHPESITSEHGHDILRNFLDLAREWNSARRSRAKVA
ncbi:MAG: aminodeoxychorismate/anthranilate synthase component II [Methylocystis sp.]|nr:aminodeoxychorismate/anthranilate synthase component II [Methylocystis sp.]